MPGSSRFSAGKMSGYLHMVEAVENGDKLEPVPTRFRNRLRNRRPQPVFELPWSGHDSFTMPVDDPKWHTSPCGETGKALPLGQAFRGIAARIVPHRLRRTFESMRIVGNACLEGAESGRQASCRRRLPELPAGFYANKQRGNKGLEKSLIRRDRICFDETACSLAYRGILPEWAEGQLYLPTPK